MLCARIAPRLSARNAGNPAGSLVLGQGRSSATAAAPNASATKPLAAAHLCHLDSFITPPALPLAELPVCSTSAAKRRTHSGLARLPDLEGRRAAARELAAPENTADTPSRNPKLYQLPL